MWKGEIAKWGFGVLALVCACGGRAEQAGANTATAGEPGRAGSASGGFTSGGGSPESGGSGNDGTTVVIIVGGGGSASDPPRPPSERCIGPCAIDGPRALPLPRPRCPEDAPTDGAACDSDGLDCSYGESSEAACRSRYTCQDSEVSTTPRWGLDRSTQGSHPCTTLAICPTAAPAAGSACELQSPATPCVYDPLLCYCQSPSAVIGSMGSWVCYGSPADLRCPARQPNLGEGCAVEGVQCDYGYFCLDPAFANVRCVGGEWRSSVGAYTCTE